MTNEHLRQGNHRVTVNGAELAYEVHGRGPVAIAVPGGPGFGASYLRMPEVEQHLTIVYLDLVGTGASTRLAERAQYRRSRDVADLEAVRKALALEGAYVIGHSYGGFVALDHALAYPGAFAGLVLYDTAPATGAEWQQELVKNIASYHDRPWFAASNVGWEEHGKAQNQADIEAVLRKIAPFYLHAYEAAPARWDAWFANAQLSFERTKGTIELYDVRARLPEIKTPALVLVGATDFICPPSGAKVMAEQMPSATLVVLAQSGHFAHVEEPAAFAAAVGKFVGR